MSDFIEVHVTTDSREEADRICVAVVNARLAACAQVSAPIRSTYWWRGKIEQAEEYFLMIKTTRNRFDEVAQLIRQHHSYEVPEIVAVSLVDGITDYLQWISAETQGADVQL